ncbi:MAG TPA: GDP-L-fucose synthase [Phycisphaerae bacterium]|nr:GDP-L-fucose synthase [Phycisphaerae bacterium]
MDLTRQRIVLTGGAGFLGQQVYAQLFAAGVSPDQIAIPRRTEYDLTKSYQVARMYADFKPTVVIHLAAEVGGIGANRENPGRFFYATLAMGMHLIERGRQAGVKKFVQIGTVCAYPKHTPVPFKEEDLWAGYPEETNAPYGVAKKALLVMLQAYRAQYGFNGVYLLPVNLYGPGDNFDLASSHVIPALIRKFVEAKARGEKKVDVWGTGTASREFLYVEDCARAILLAAERYDEAEPINIGSGSEITIRDLATKIQQLVGYEGQIVWDPTQPDGQPRRCLDCSRARERLGFTAEIDLDEGLRRTVEWYQSSRGHDAR